MSSDTKKKMTTKKKMSSADIVSKVIQYREASDRFRQTRLARNSFNWDMYNLKMDFSHKVKGQSTEFVPKMANGAEHLAAIIQNGITANSDDWFVCEEGYNQDDVFDKDTNYKLLNYFLKGVSPHTFIANMGKYGGLDSRTSVKVGGKILQIPSFKGYDRLKKEDVIHAMSWDEVIKGKLKAKMKKEVINRWVLDWTLIDYVDFYDDIYPNPDGPLYRIQETTMDLHVLKKMAKDFPDVYDVKEINQITDHFERPTEQYYKDRKSDKAYDTRSMAGRKKVVLTELWGTILNDDAEAEERLTDVVCCIANDKYLIRPPQKIIEDTNSNEDPFVVSTIIDLPHTTDGKGFLDAAAALNKSYIEGFNLMLDGMMAAIKGVRQLRINWLAKPSQISKGIKAGQILYVNDDVPAGAHVLEQCPTGNIPQDAFIMLKYLESLCNEAQYMNEIRVGNLPAASTKATVAQLADQSISGVFSGFVRQFEDKCIVPLLNKTYRTIIEHIDEANLRDDELISLIGEEKAMAIGRMTKEERYIRGANSVKFTVRGISAYVQKMRDFQKYTNLLSVISQNQNLYQDFNQVYSVSKLLQQILMATGLREEQLRLSDTEARIAEIRNKTAKIIAEAKANAGQGGGNGGSGLPSNPVPQQTDETTMTSQGPQGRMEGNVNAG